jgi:hypothetical protein
MSVTFQVNCPLRSPGSESIIRKWNRPTETKHRIIKRVDWDQIQTLTGVVTNFPLDLSFCQTIGDDEASISSCCDRCIVSPRQG